MPGATAKPAAAPGTFTFLKQGVLFAANAVLGAALLLLKVLAVAPLVKALNCGGRLLRRPVKVATVSAAVAACSGDESHTFRRSRRGRRRDVRVLLRPEGGLPRRRRPPGAAGGLVLAPIVVSWVAGPAQRGARAPRGRLLPLPRRGLRRGRRRVGAGATVGAREDRRPGSRGAPRGGCCRTAWMWRATTWRSWWTVASRTCCTAP
ncbi:hypothetical protein PVAP13_6KG176606 [Panicum virgatum]|uniref:Uncharacterized protein n=1 Tax=Panicum virgatum TaxID=38727 RepID=A0A8T0RAL0_PANVG|nr:hypothetical protein PVAP13_6KG176606 [Panicum virgatum]